MIWGSLGDFCVCIQTQSNQVIIIIIIPLLLSRFYPTKFSETDDPILTKLHRKVDPHLKRCIEVLVFSKWPPFQNGRQYKNEKIVNNSKMKTIQWKWIFTGSKTCCIIWRPYWFAIMAILNPKWPPKYKNSPVWTKFYFQVDYDVANWYPSMFCSGGYFESKMAAKIQKSSDWDEIWIPSRLWCCELISIVGLLWRPFWIQNGPQNTKILRFGRNFASK